MISQSKNPRCPASWSPDGKHLLFFEHHPTNGFDIWVLPMEGDRKPLPFLQTPAREQMPAFSPDGGWLAYVSDESGQSEVYVLPFPGPGEKRQLSVEGGVQPRWARSGRELFYRNGRKMMVVDVQIEPTFHAGKPRLLFEGNYWLQIDLTDYDVTADGQRFLMLKPSERPPATQVNVVLNWFEDLKRRVPSGKN
ncbi:MAG: PD40 domain-containing protein [Acidobacteria bacterium]|nr:PD40 domain-containing protein [Acidobacteriota bacterium]